MWQLIGAESGREYTRHKYKEALYRLMEKEWPTKGKMRRGKTSGVALLAKPMPEPMIVRRVK
ncbi:hypothetical protein LAS9624_01114 [Latilactobacillus sakei]|nr:hypothetical protein LAS9624_01114 [Latilactobacillus sakei]